MICGHITQISSSSHHKQVHEKMSMNYGEIGLINYILQFMHLILLANGSIFALSPKHHFTLYNFLTTHAIAIHHHEILIKRSKPNLRQTMTVLRLATTLMIAVLH
jgi:hypothetical protein